MESFEHKITLEFASKALRQILNLITKNQGKVRLVGGCIRDAIKGFELKDIDLVTDLLPEEIEKIATNNKIKIIDCGKAFGTIKLITSGEQIEITTLRKDVSCDGRYAKVEFTDDFKLDAARRDFTINALSYDINNKILYDYFGGLEDLHSNKVKFIGDPDKRITEDYLRILRFFRFSARFAAKIDKLGLDACERNAANLLFLSKERIFHEMVLVLSTKCDIIGVMRAMLKAKIFSTIAPNLTIHLNNLIKFESKLSKEILINASDIYLIRCAILFAGNQIDQLRSWLIEYKFPLKDQKIIINYVVFIQKAFNDKKTDEENLLYQLNKIWFKDYSSINNYILITRALYLTDKKDNDLFERYKIKPPQFPIPASELMQKGIHGKKLGDIINTLEVEWIKSNFTKNKESLLEIIAKIIK